MQKHCPLSVETNSTTALNFRGVACCLGRVKFLLVQLWVWLFISLQCWAVVLGQGSPPSQPGQPTPTTETQKAKLRKLAPETVLVQMNNGKGNSTVVYARNAGEALPLLDWTAAVGPTNSIAKDRIKVEWSGQPKKLDKYETLTLNITVDTSETLEAKASYKGRVIFVWPDAEPQPQDFSITEVGGSDFALSVPKVDAFLLLGQPKHADIIVSNTGNEKITKLTFSSTDLEDGNTHRRAAFGNPQSVTLDLNAKREQTVAFTLPNPSYAGTYNGTLNVIANDHLRKSIPLTVITRGPTFGFLYWLPFVLFCLTVGIGYWLTTYLEQWFAGGGLELAQTLLTLEQKRVDLDKTLKEIREWEAKHPNIELGTARLRLADGLRESNELLEKPGASTLESLKASVGRFTILAAAGRLLIGKVETVTKEWPGADLKPVIDDLDDVLFPSAADGVDKYREELEKVLIKHATTKKPVALGVPHAERATPEQLELKIESMNMLHRLAVIIVVFITAYTTLYWNNSDFGTLLDYLTVFLWALGLSTTGASILTRARSAHTITRES